MRVSCILSIAVLASPMTEALEGEAAGSASQEDQGCKITARMCRNFPEYTRTQFRDALGEEHMETRWNEAACMKRAEDFHHWCGNREADGAQVAATFGPKQLTQLYHQGACDAGLSQWDAFCYKYFWEMKSWPDAEAKCRELDAHLCSIHSQAENRFVAVLSRGLKAWLGYTDIDQDTHYQWTDNTQDDFTNFAKNCTGREHEPDCKPEEVQQQWYKSKGYETSPYVCKMNAKMPGMALLRNTTAQTLTEMAWSTLLPALARVFSAGAGSVSATAANEVPPLKLQEAVKVSGAAADKAKEAAAGGASPKPRLMVPKGSVL